MRTPPSFSSLIIERDGVYPVSEDTRLLARSIDISSGERMLEVGCGTGYVSLCAASWGALVTGVDISEDAVELSRENARRNGMHATFHQGDMFDAVSGKFDVIACNPPYLPSESFKSTDYDRCWDGGAGGRSFTDRFIDGVDHVVAPGGRIYLLQSSLCDPHRSITRLIEHGYNVTITGCTKLFFEQLCVLCAHE
ncbi:methyltransferase domain-containing protein [archaeon]|nr:MAG: methyltransferase domain-containing protein [archaeon]